MARGWESKSVEEQIELAASGTHPGEKARLTLEEAASQRRGNVLAAARASILQRLQAAKNKRYRRLLEDELAALDAQIKALY